MHRTKSKGIFRFFPVLLIIALCAVGIYVWQQGSIQQITARLSQLLPSVMQPDGTPANHQPQDAVIKFAILSDAHQDTRYFPNIVHEIASRDDLNFVAYLGDISDAGDKTKLLQGKAVLDTITPPVYVLPGDHDYNWFPQHNLNNFMQVFNLSRTYTSFDQQGQHFLFIDNSDLNNGVEAAQWQWIKQDLEEHADQPIYVFMSTPLSNPYLAFKAMGSQSDEVKQQSAELGQLLKQYQIKAVFAGDTHTFAQFTDKDTDLPIVTVGAAGSTKNLLPLYVIVDIFSDGSYNVTSKPLKQAIPVEGSD